MGDGEPGTEIPAFWGGMCWQAADKLMGTVILRSRQAVLSIAKEESAFA
jgi:hypothetical protein